MNDELGVILPPGVDRPPPPSSPENPSGSRATIVNETDLPDAVVQEAVATHIEENASMLGVNAGTTFQTYANDGSLLARSKFRVPSNVIEEIVLARDLAERDDDIGATIGAMIATAFGEGMQHTHEDEVTEALFDEIARNANLDHIWAELLREWLIAGQFTTAAMFTSESFQFHPVGADRQRTRNIVAPLIGVLPAETVRVLGNDLFGTAQLALKPATGKQERWLQEFFSERTSPARQAEMRTEDPVLAALCVEEIEETQETTAFLGDYDDQPFGRKLYRLNPRLAHRSTMPKGAWSYPRPPLCRNFALLEAKRLLNIMDYALLQGGSNFLVVAKKGSDQRPAQQEEITNLHEVVRRASRTGVIIGDHRLSIEIITPDLGALLEPKKRNLIGRKLANALLRVPEADEDAGGEGMKARVELISRVITADRLAIKRHVANNIYRETVKRNGSSFEKGAAKIWFPKIILQGSQAFQDYVLKLRDRADISRRTAVDVAGFSYEHEVQRRKREKPDDRVMTPPPVPFSSPNAGPQDNPPGRPRGASSANGKPGSPSRVSDGPARARPRQVVQRNAGETVRAMYDEEQDLSFRIGELTYSILEEYAETKTENARMTALERRAVEAEGPTREGPIAVIPVNGEFECDGFRAVRLDKGLSMIVGYRLDDDAIVAKALCFREPEFTTADAEERALRWGFDVEGVVEETADQPATANGGYSSLELHVHADGGVKRKVVTRDEHGAIVSIEERPVDADE